MTGKCLQLTTCASCEDKVISVLGLTFPDLQIQAVGNREADIDFMKELSHDAGP